MDREDAGCRLADALRFRDASHVVIGVAHGGVQVAAALARSFGLTLDTCIVRKLNIARSVPITVGAVAEGGVVYFSRERLDRFRVAKHELSRAVSRESLRVSQLARLVRECPRVDLSARDVIIVDEAIMTGMTMRAALRSVMSQAPRRVEIAVPVGREQVVDALRAHVDRVTCLETEVGRGGLAAHYQALCPVTDAQVVAALSASHRF